MFLLNSCLSLFSAATFLAPLLPKLRGHFAEFLDSASPVGLGILSPSTCVGLRYGYGINNSGFSRHMCCMLRYFKFAPRHAFGSCGGFASRTPAALAPVFPFPAHALHMRPRSSVMPQCRNFHLLSIGYAVKPRLRSRLTRGRSALPRKPWISGQEDSHLFLATHSGILSSLPPLLLAGTASAGIQCSPTKNPHRGVFFPGFGGVFQPRTFSARDLSTSELLRTL